MFFWHMNPDFSSSPILISVTFVHIVQCIMCFQVVLHFICNCFICGMYWYQEVHAISPVVEYWLSSWLLQATSSKLQPTMYSGQLILLPLVGSIVGYCVKALVLLIGLVVFLLCSTVPVVRLQSMATWCAVVSLAQSCPSAATSKIIVL